MDEECDERQMMKIGNGKQNEAERKRKREVKKREHMGRGRAVTTTSHPLFNLWAVVVTDGEPL